MKKILFFAICVIAFVFAGCNPDEPNIGTNNTTNENENYFFSTSETQKVQFSKGNLQYDMYGKKWYFANNQFDYIGENNFGNKEYVYCQWGHGSSAKLGYLYYSSTIDLFWNSLNENDMCKWGISINPDERPVGKFVDWGKNQIGNDAPNTWRTLTKDEWEYVLKKRSNASSLKGVANIAGVNGLILLPDNWKCPNDIIFKVGMADFDGEEYYAEHQTFSTLKWSKLEKAGAVFLPAAGCSRMKQTTCGTCDDYEQGYFYNYYNDNSLGCYWTSDTYLMLFESDEWGFEFAPYYTGWSIYEYNNAGGAVRLVKDIQ